MFSGHDHRLSAVYNFIGFRSCFDPTWIVVHVEHMAAFWAPARQTCEKIRPCLSMKPNLAYCELCVDLK